MKQIAFFLLVIFINWTSIGYVGKYRLNADSLFPVTSGQEESLPDGESEGENKIESLYHSQTTGTTEHINKSKDTGEESNALYAEKFYELLRANVFFTPPEPIC